MLKKWDHLKYIIYEVASLGDFIKDENITKLIPKTNVRDWGIERMLKYIFRTIISDIIPIKIKIELADKSTAKETDPITIEGEIPSIMERFHPHLKDISLAENNLVLLNEENSNKIHFRYWHCRDSFNGSFPHKADVYIEGSFMQSTSNRSMDNYGNTELFFRGVLVNDEDFRREHLSYPFLNLKVSILSNSSEQVLVVNRQEIKQDSKEFINKVVREAVFGALKKIFDDYSSDPENEKWSAHYLPLSTYFSYLLWAKEEDEDLNPDEFKETISGLTQKFYDYDFGNYKIYYDENSSLTDNKQPYYNSYFSFDEKLEIDGSKPANDWLLANNTHYYKEFVIKDDGSISAFKISNEPVECIEFSKLTKSTGLVAVAKDDYAYWLYIVKCMFDLYKANNSKQDDVDKANNLKQDNVEQLAAVFPVVKQYLDISVEKLVIPISSKTRDKISIKKYGRYIHSPFPMEEINDLYEFISKNSSADMISNFIDKNKLEKSYAIKAGKDEHVKKLINGIISEREDSVTSKKNTEKELINLYIKFSNTILDSIKK